MQYNRKITISAGESRKSVNWQPQIMWLSELYKRLETPARSPETRREYLAMKKPKQDALKDVGGFVGGTLSGPRRKANAVTGRDLLTLDLDNLPPGCTDAVLQRLAGLGCGYCVYSTRKHAPEAPRLRAVLPLNRTAMPDEYEPCARKLAELIQPEMTWFDPTTFEASRLMYWPSCCADGVYVFHAEDKPLLSTDDVLGLYDGGAWQDLRNWPQVPGAVPMARLAAKQGDPLEKTGIVGAFCRTYDVPAAMDKFLPGVYEKCDTDDKRYTFTGGSTTGGAVLYDGGKFLYSHHATDPCSNKLVNAFDLVRLHRFGDLDDEAKPETPSNRLPSFEQMSRLAAADKIVSGLLQRERYEQASADFAGLVPENAPQDLDWLGQLKVHPKTGKTENTIDNVWIILENDPKLKEKFALNQFAGRGEVFGALPWNPAEERRPWEDNDNHGAYWYLEKIYSITGASKIDGALSLHAAKHAFDEVKDYLEALVWDGVPRLDTLFIDYLGAEDTEYTRAVTRKMFAAAAARALTPGIKFDTMLILGGAQGLGKSTLISTMAHGWFNDSIRTFEGKEASELLQGVWLVEIAELQAFHRVDVNRIKQFVSQQHDRFRAAYGRHVKEFPRRCVFFGTTNTAEYLRDLTGNRRFWPVDVGLHPAVKDVWLDLPEERDQIWAEAVLRWRLGEKLYLSEALEETAKAIQEQHREHSVQEGIIRDFLEQPIPADWNSRDLFARRTYWNNPAAYDGELVPRTKVCALEIWCEALGSDARFIKYTDTMEINAIIEMQPEWRRMQKTSRFGYCKVQRGFEKVSK